MNEALCRAKAEEFASAFDPKPHVVQAGDALQVAYWDHARSIGFTAIFSGEGTMRAFLEITSPASPATAALAIRAALDEATKRQPT